MKLLYVFTVAYLSFLVLALPIQGAEKENEISSSEPESQVVNDLYPGLTTGALTYAVASELSEGVLLKAGELVINNKELAEEIAKSPEQMQPKLKKNAFFVLEQIATTKLFLAEAKIEAAKTGTVTAEKDEQTIIQNYISSLVKDVKVSDEEIINFYKENKEMLGGAVLAQVKPQIEQLLTQQKLQKLVDERVRTIGRRMQIEISALWLKEQAALAKDNPVDKARASGKPSLIDFGSTSCVPCKMMAPILETIREKYKGKLNLILINVEEEPILASRYGVHAVPVQVFFDKTGKEVFRHVGFFSQEQIEAKLSEMGLK